MGHFARAAVMAAAIAALAPLEIYPASAQDPLAVIKERQALMKQQAADLKAIQNFVTGQTDAGTALATVNDLASLPPKIVGLFPPGTSFLDFPNDTHAKPNIWQQWEKFQEVPIALERAETQLVAAVKRRDKEAVLDALDAVGRTGCGVCHTNFRAPM
jgi:cytochrome c556